MKIYLLKEFAWTPDVVYERARPRFFLSVEKARAEFEKVCKDIFAEMQEEYEEDFKVDQRDDRYICQSDPEAGVEARLLTFETED